MKKFLPILFLFIACNNSSEKKEAMDDTAKMDHGHTTVSQGDVPAQPAVPEGARVFFENLKDGETMKSNFLVRLGTEKISVDTAGPVKEASGHHHILIDRGSIPMGETIPMDSVNLHFGKAQKEAELKLTPGKHTLTLQFADGLHRSYGEKLSSTINVTVKE